MINKLLKSKEKVIALLILLIIVVFSLLSPTFRSVSTILNMIRALIIPATVGLSVLLVFIVGGFDMSFMAVASVSMFATVKILNTMENPPLILAFLIGGCIGMILGLINAFFVTVTKISIFICTLATHFVFEGFCLAFLGADMLQVPESMIRFSKSYLFQITASDGSTIGLPTATLIVIALYILVYLLLRFTKFGRKLYAIGGDAQAARRSGINVDLTLVLLFILTGFICSVAGIMNASLLRLAVSGDMIGSELIILAAVILGGASPSEGKGTVIGTFLGILLIIIIRNSLNLIHVPSYWQEAVLGAIIIAGTILGSISNIKRSDMLQ